MYVFRIDMGNGKHDFEKRQIEGSLDKSLYAGKKATSDKVWE